jgi:hypothetical protein
MEEALRRDSFHPDRHRLDYMAEVWDAINALGLEKRFRDAVLARELGAMSLSRMLIVRSQRHIVVQ